MAEGVAAEKMVARLMEEENDKPSGILSKELSGISTIKTINMEVVAKL